MVCIYCNNKLDVTNSRPQKSRNQVWRRRQCVACGAVFTAVEALDLALAVMVVKNGLAEPSNGRAVHSKNKAKDSGFTDLQSFDSDRLFISLYESLRHRATASQDARGLSQTVVAHIIKNCAHGRVDRRTLRQLALSTLQRFDPVAASHYAAFHP